MLSLLSFLLILSAKASSLVLEVGQEKSLPHTRTLRLEDGKLLRASANGSGFKLVALKPGYTHAVINNKSHEIHILSKAQVRTKQVLEKWSRQRLGLKTMIERGEILLAGRLLRAKDWLDLEKFCAGCRYRARLGLTAGVESDIERELKVATLGRGLSSPALRWNPAATWLVHKPLPALEPLAASLGIEIKNEDATVDLTPLVRTQIFVLETKRERTRQWGIQWPNSVTAQILPKKVDPFSALSLTAVALENEGTGKILASPTLLCRSGQQAEFLAGGEFPIKIINVKMQDVVWKKYGILLKVKPIADRFGRMRISLETEISSIDPSRTVDGVPGLFTNRVLSHFDLAEPKTIAISGLIKSEDSQSLQGLPGVAKIPVLGALFGSQDFRENRSELLILVRPEVISPDEDTYD